MKKTNAEAEADENAESEVKIEAEAEAEAELSSATMSKKTKEVVFVIGGLVDEKKTDLLNCCFLNQACKLGASAAKLPLQATLGRAVYPVLNVNTVAEALCHYSDSFHSSYFDGQPALYDSDHPLPLPLRTVALSSQLGCNVDGSCLLAIADTSTCEERRWAAAFEAAVPLRRRQQASKCEVAYSAYQSRNQAALS